MQIQTAVEENRNPIIKHREFARFMLFSCLTLGLYSAFLVLTHTPIIGRLVGRYRFSFPLAVILTVVTLGIFPGVYVVVLAFDLQRFSLEQAIPGRQPHLGTLVLMADIFALITALASGGLAIIVSSIFVSSN